MLTNAEYLKDKGNQSLILDRIVSELRGRGVWGTRGLYTSMAHAMGFSPAYIGQVLAGKKPIAEEFFGKIKEYLGVSDSWLRGEKVTLGESAQMVMSRRYLPSPLNQLEQDVRRKKLIADTAKFKTIVDEVKKLTIDEIEDLRSVLDKILDDMCEDRDRLERESTPKGAISNTTPPEKITSKPQTEDGQAS